MASPLAQRIAQNLQTIATQRGLSQQDIAEATGLSQPTISRWLRGENTVTANRLDKLAAGLHVDIEDLCAEPVAALVDGQAE